MPSCSFGTSDATIILLFLVVDLDSGDTRLWTISNSLLLIEDAFFGDVWLEDGLGLSTMARAILVPLVEESDPVGDTGSRGALNLSAPDDD